MQPIKHTYHLDENDYLTFQLYSGSKSEVVTKKRKNEWMIFWFIPLVLGLYNVTNNKLILGAYFLVMAVLIFFFYSKYFNYRYKKRYEKIIRMSYQDAFGSEEVLMVNNEGLHIKNNTGEGKVKLDAVEKITEIKSHIFIKLKEGASIILPKKEIDFVALKKELEKVHLSVQQELDWEWK